MRCCWIAETKECVATWSAPASGTFEDLEKVAFYGGDQAAAQFTGLRGGTATAGDGDGVGLSSLDFSPFFMSSGAFPSNFTVGGKRPILRQQRWRPHELLRRSDATLESGRTVDVESSVRLGFEERQVLVRVTLRNPGASRLETTVSGGLGAQVQWFEATG